MEFETQLTRDVAAHHTIKGDADIDGQKRTVCALFALDLRMAIAMFPSGALAVDKPDSEARLRSICSLKVDWEWTRLPHIRGD